MTSTQTTDHRPYVVTRDGADVSPILPTDADVLHWLHQRVPYSADHAMRHEGYGVRRVDTAGTWGGPQARNMTLMARGNLRHDHPAIGTAAWREWIDAGEHTDEHADMVRTSCAACALDGYGEVREIVGEGRHKRVSISPNYAAWTRVYVQAGKPIPQRYRAAFIDDLNDAENTSYAAALARDVATFGVRFTD
jgi:hypothetical protein